MIESNRDFGTFEMFCDQVGCTNSNEFDTDGDWHAMISQAKADGWKIVKEDAGYSHMCPDCVGEGKAKSSYL